MDEKTKKLLEALAKGNSRIVGPFDVHNLEDIPKVLEEAINEIQNPIVVFKGTRIGVQTNIKKCSRDEAKDACIRIIATALNLFHQDERNDILYQAIQLTDDVDGELYEELDKEE